MTRKSWLEERRGGIGASDMPVLCGLSRWSSPLALWHTKVYGAIDGGMTAEQRWGLRLEDAIAGAYLEERPGVELENPGLVRHPEYPWMLATLDRKALWWPLGLPDRPLELKTCSAFHADDWGEPGTDQVPENHLVQVQHQMAVTGCEVADVAVLIGGQDFRIYTVPRSEAIIARLLEIGEAFWRRVVDRDPPEPDWAHPGTPALLDAMYPPNPEQGVHLGEEAVPYLEQYLACREAKGRAEESQSAARARLVHLMGTAGQATLPTGHVLTRKVVKREGHTVGPSESIQLFVRQPKSKKGKTP